MSAQESTLVPQKPAEQTMSIDDVVDRAESDFQIPKGALRALGMNESKSGKAVQAYDDQGNYIQSPTGARGPLQFTRGTARDMGIDRDNPIENVLGAAKMLRDNYTALRPLLSSDTEAWAAAAVAHNRGLGAARSMIRNGQFIPTGSDGYTPSDRYAADFLNRWADLGGGAEPTFNNSVGEVVDETKHFNNTDGVVVDETRRFNNSNGVVIDQTRPNLKPQSADPMTRANTQVPQRPDVTSQAMINEADPTRERLKGGVPKGAVTPGQYLVPVLPNDTQAAALHRMFMQVGQQAGLEPDRAKNFADTWLSRMDDKRFYEDGKPISDESFNQSRKAGKRLVNFSVEKDADIMADLRSRLNAGYIEAAPSPGVLSRAKEAIAPYTPGLASINNPYGNGIRTVAAEEGLLQALNTTTLGLTNLHVDPSRFKDDDERMVANAIGIAGSTLAGMELLKAAGYGVQLLNKVPAVAQMLEGLQGAGAGGRALSGGIQGAETFGGLQAAREGIKGIKGESGGAVDAARNIGKEALVGGVFGVAGTPNAEGEPYLKVPERAGLVGASTYAIDRATGASIPDAAQSGITNAAFEAAGGLEKRVMHERLGELTVTGKRSDGKLNTVDKDGVPHVIQNPRKGNQQAVYLRTPVEAHQVATLYPVAEARAQAERVDTKVPGRAARQELQVAPARVFESAPTVNKKPLWEMSPDEIDAGYQQTKAALFGISSAIDNRNEPVSEAAPQNASAFNEDGTFEVLRNPIFGKAAYKPEHVLEYPSAEAGGSVKGTPYNLKGREFDWLKSVGEDPKDFVAVVREDGSRKLVSVQSIFRLYDSTTTQQPASGAAQLNSRSSNGEAAGVSGSARTDASTPAAELGAVSHPDPKIDGQPVVSETQDGRVVVANPDNVSGVSVVKDRGRRGLVVTPRAQAPTFINKDAILQGSEDANAQIDRVGKQLTTLQNQGYTFNRVVEGKRIPVEWDGKYLKDLREGVHKGNPWGLGAILFEKPNEGIEIIPPKNQGQEKEAAAPENIQPESLARTDASAPAVDTKVPRRTGQEGSVPLDLLLAGTPQFVEQDVAPAVKATVGGVKETADAVKGLLAAPNRGVTAKETANIVRANASDMARQLDIAEKSLEGAQKFFNRQDAALNYQFIDRVEAGDPQPDTTTQKFADTLRELLDQRRDAVQNLGQGKLENFIENYFPHIWKDPVKAKDVFAQMLGRKPLEGSKSFLKQRSIPTVLEGLQNGLEPVSTNPVDLAILKLREMDKYVMAHNIMDEMKGRNLLTFFPIDETLPEGYVEINDKVGSVYGKPTFRTVNGEQVTVPVRAGRYAAPEPAAKVLNNYLSPGLGKYAAFRAWRYGGNAMNQAQLGFSFFHAGMTSIDAVVSRAAVGLEDVLRYGKPVRGLKTLLSTPVSPFTNLIQGSKVLKEWSSPGSQGADIAEMVNAVVEAGGRAKQDSMYSNQAVKNMREAFKTGNVIGGVLRLPASFTEVVSKPVMEWLVPRQKLGVFAEMARREIERLGPDVDRTQVRDALAKAWDSTDNRMGQMVYDNLFWNKVTKDLLMGSVRSVGWNLGTVRELGGGIKDAVTVPVRAVQKMQGKQVDPLFTHRMAYATALPIVVGTLGAMTMYLLTGHGPEELKDYFFPKTGNIDENGNPERISFPSYMKDVYHFKEDPAATVTGKLHPMIGNIAEMLANKDYYGTEIRNADDPLMQQLLDTAKHALAGFQPFAIRGFRKERERGTSTAKSLLPFIGITPAPSFLNKSDAEKMMSDISGDRKPVGARTKEEAARSKAKYEIERDMRAGKDVTQKFNEAVAAGVLMSEDMDTISRDAELTPKQLRFKSLGLEDALSVFDAMTLKEKQEVVGILGDKESLIETIPPQRRDKVLQRFIEAMKVQATVPVR